MMVFSSGRFSFSMYKNDTLQIVVWFDENGDFLTDLALNKCTVVDSELDLSC